MFPARMRGRCSILGMGTVEHCRPVLVRASVLGRRSAPPAPSVVVGPAGAGGKPVMVSWNRVWVPASPHRTHRTRASPHRTRASPHRTRASPHRTRASHLTTPAPAQHTQT